MKWPVSCSTVNYVCSSNTSCSASFKYNDHCTNHIRGCFQIAVQTDMGEIKTIYEQNRRLIHSMETILLITFKDLRRLMELDLQFPRDDKAAVILAKCIFGAETKADLLTQAKRDKENRGGKE